MRGQYLITMDIHGTLRVWGKDNTWHTVFCQCGVGAYRFDGSECMTIECLPSWAIDAYYVENLPESFRQSCKS